MVNKQSLRSLSNNNLTAGLSK